MSLHTVEKNGLTLTIGYDEWAESPLEGYDVKIAYLRRSRYTLGNESVSEDKMADIRDRIDAGKLYGLSVYAYVHSGVALNTAPFYCPFDSGHSGFVYIEKDSPDIAHLKDNIEKIYDFLSGCVENYSEYLNGSNYVYTIKDADGDVIDSCCMGTWGDFDALCKECEGFLDGWVEDLKKEAAAKINLLY